MESTGADFPRSIDPKSARDSELRVAGGRGFQIDIKPELERCLRCEQVDDVRSVGSSVEKRSAAQEKYVASRQVCVGGIDSGVGGKGMQLVGERFSWPVEIAEAVVIDTTGAALRAKDMRVLDGEFSEEEGLSET